MNGVTCASFVNSLNKMSTTIDISDLADVSKEATPIFLQTHAAQGIAGIFVWVALFLTCQQVFIVNKFFKVKSFIFNIYLKFISRCAL